MKQFTTKNQKIGEFGENIIKDVFEKDEYVILCKNYSTQSGEIDLVLEKDGNIIFIEVKTIVVGKNTRFTPEENFSNIKKERFLNTVYEFLQKESVSHETNWFIWLVCVYLDQKRNKYKIRVWKQPF